jgi:UDP-N-acetylmuramyl tripeptide synthase
MALFSAKTAVARATGAVSRRTGRGGGTTLPGKTLLRLAPDAIERLAGRLRDGSVLVSATNGKTTTTAMAASILAPDQIVCTNASGANLLSGVASALLSAPAGATLGVIEVDEAALPEVARRLGPRAILLGNLFRDQLDRYGELELLAGRWRDLLATLPDATRLVVCADDPLLAGLVLDRREVVWFGIDDPAVARGALEHAADSTGCPRCSTLLEYAAVYLGHLGDYACPACGFARPPLDVAARAIDASVTDTISFSVERADGADPVTLAVPGLYNVYNATGAIALAGSIGCAPDVAASRLGTFAAAFGRYEQIAVGDRAALLVLVKNPAGANEALRTVAPRLVHAPLLLVLNDRIADGRDVSWIWDVDFEPFLASATAVHCAGTRAADIALRARYAGVPLESIVVHDDLAEAFDATLAAAGAGGTAVVLPTYTAMLELRAIIADRGLAARYWEPTR